MKKGCTFYFVRHGETYFNHYGKMQGWSNTPLRSAGRDDVRSSGRGLADIEFDAVYTSDLYRTVETATIILEENKNADKLAIETMPEFREVFFGSFEGADGNEVWNAINQEMDYETIEDMFEQSSIPERMDATKRADPYHDAENFQEFWSRIEQGMIKLIDKHRDTGEKVLVVAHGNTIRYLLANLVPHLENPESLANASVSIAAYYDGAYHLEVYNQTSHFQTDSSNS